MTELIYALRLADLESNQNNWQNTALPSLDTVGIYTFINYLGNLNITSETEIYQKLPVVMGNYFQEIFTNSGISSQQIVDLALAKHSTSGTSVS